MTESLDFDLKQKFRTLDADGNGMLEYTKFRSLLRSGNADMTDEELRLVFEAVCLPGGECVRFDDLVEFLCGPGPPQPTGQEPESERRGQMRVVTPLPPPPRSMSPMGQVRQQAQSDATFKAMPPLLSDCGMMSHALGSQGDLSPSSKKGKGVQNLSSSYWKQDLACFIAANLPLLRNHVLHVEHASREYQYRHFLNQSHVLMLEAEKGGLRSTSSLEQWLMASWLTMAAAEVDAYDFQRYSLEERDQLKQRFFDDYKQTTPRPAEHSPAAPLDASPVGRAARMDLMPKVASERLAIHNEMVVANQSEKANAWMTSGVKISRRLDSIKRHFEFAHRLEAVEDSVAHIMWNFMCIYHTARVFPNMNDMPDFESIFRAASPEPQVKVRI
eukprot:TRINITY_DN73794_c0_g1_i1.p1 TRINITY_DN73794_c0_g1~~TRINITY_DN73794_c0_g1_i1.p1  ORF type:complete len:387 (+),score=66.00 TRINITY_DN73794_c0_g1_i1:87-1247(+)